jgi:hypothetical protein
MGVMGVRPPRGSAAIADSAAEVAHTTTRPS